MISPLARTSRFSSLASAGRCGIVCGAVVLWLFSNCAGHAGLAQEVARPPIDALDETGMAAELARLQRICERLKLDDESRVLQHWLAPQASDAHLLYLPVEADPHAGRGNIAGSETQAAHDSWLKHFTAARQRHAQYWIAEARRAAAAGDEWAAYRHVWRAIREDPSNAEAKRVLGPLLQATTVRAKPRTWRVADPQLGWTAGSFTRLDTANYQIISRADAATTLAIAQQLERFYVLWTQVFYPLWAPPKVTIDRLAGRGTNWAPRRDFRVVVCKDRREYLEALGVAESNIGVSVGYYNAQSRLAFFYPSDQLDVTMFHELTHQLLAEGSALRSAQQAKHERDFWLVEGIALYMESLVDCQDHWRVGGWTAPRLQSARYRALHDGLWLDWDKFSAGGMEEWKVDPEISKLYTQAAGLTHFFLDKRLPEDSTTQSREPAATSDGAPADYDADASRVALFNALISVYSSEKIDGKLLELLGHADAQRNYVHFLRVRDCHLQALARSGSELSTTTELVLTRSQLSPHSWQQVGRFENLTWLDASFSNATSVDLKWLEKMKQLQRLSLEEIAIDAGVLAAIARLPRLKELDLSHCPIGDSELAALRGAASLETLWLSGTKIGPASAALIESLPQLNYVALDHTAMPPADAQRLSERIESRRKK